MFMLCEAMKWSHLPVAGGIYDQHPDLIDGFLIIFQERAKHQEEEDKKREQDMARRTGPRATSRPSGRRRR